MGFTPPEENGLLMSRKHFPVIPKQGLTSESNSDGLRFIDCIEKMDAATITSCHWLLHPSFEATNLPFGLTSYVIKTTCAR